MSCGIPERHGLFFFFSHPLSICLNFVDLLQETESTMVGDAVLRPGMWIEMNHGRVGPLNQKEKKSCQIQVLEGSPNSLGLIHIGLVIGTQSNGNDQFPN